MWKSKKLLIFPAIYLLMLYLPILGAGDHVNMTDLSFNLRHVGLLANSMKLALLSAVIATALGFFAALYIKTGFMADKWYRYFFILFLPIPFYTYALSWIYFIRMFSIPFPALLKYSLKGFGACLYVEVLEYFPLALLLALIGMESISASDIEAASVYKRLVIVVRDIVLKEIAPYLYAATGLIVILSVTDFSVPSMFQYNTYTLDLFSVYGRTGNVTLVCLKTLPVILLMLVPLSWLLGGMRKFGTVKSGRLKMGIHLNGWMRVVSGLAFAVCIIQILIPVITFIVTTGSVRVFADAFSSVKEELLVSITVSLLAAIFGTIIAFFPAVMIADSDNGVLGTVSMLPVAIPGAIGAMGLLKVVNRSFLHVLGDSVILSAIGCGIKIAPFMVLIICIYRRYTDRHLTEIAWILADKRKKAFLMECRLILPGLMIAFMLAFFMTYAEEGIMLVLMAPGLEAITVKIYNYLHYGASEYVSAFCLISVGVIAVIELTTLAIYRLIVVGMRK
ncbi:MAG: hypothetical protein K6E68_04730 [Lachnospiraceae bacterium]|nr:hypothetical protein [Lachnospiraceae bacterium]